MNQAIYTPPFDDALRVCLQTAVDSKAKSLSTLGRLELLAAQIGLIQNTDIPQLARPVMMVFVADHGIVHVGVGVHPQAVTAQMVLNFIAGGAAINVLCRQHEFALEVVNAGVAAPLWAADAPDLIDAPVGSDTHSFADESVRQVAMTTEERDRAVALGVQRAVHHATFGTSAITLGEMGIANTTSAACLMVRLCNLPVAQCVGRGTRLDDDGLAHKRAVLEAAVARRADIRGPLGVLTYFDNFEVVAMVGTVFGAVQCHMVILVDGFIATATVLVAVHVTPNVLRFCVLGYASDKHGHHALLGLLDTRPLLSLSLRLGESSGAVLTYLVVMSTVALLHGMVTFASAGVSERASP